MHRFTIGVLDTETTGLSPKFGDRLVEIGITKIRNGEMGIDAPFSTFLNPERSIPPQATRINQITDEMVADAPRFLEIVDDFSAYLNDLDLILIHNAPFDLGFLTAEYEHIGRSLALPPVLCTLSLSREFYPEFQTHNLDALSRRFGVTISAAQRHRAVGDTILTAKVFEKIYEENPLEIMSRLTTLVTNR